MHAVFGVGSLGGAGGCVGFDLEAKPGGSFQWWLFLSEDAKRFVVVGLVVGAGSGPSLYQPCQDPSSVCPLKYLRVQAFSSYHCPAAAKPQRFSLDVSGWDDTLSRAGISATTFFSVRCGAGLRTSLWNDETLLLPSAVRRAGRGSGWLNSLLTLLWKRALGNERFLCRHQSVLSSLSMNTSGGAELNVT